MMMMFADRADLVDCLEFARASQTRSKSRALQCDVIRMLEQMVGLRDVSMLSIISSVDGFSRPFGRQVSRDPMVSFEVTTKRQISSEPLESTHQRSVWPTQRGTPLIIVLPLSASASASAPSSSSSSGSSRPSSRAIYCIDQRPPRREVPADLIELAPAQVLVDDELEGPPRCWLGGMAL